MSILQLNWLVTSTSPCKLSTLSGERKKKSKDKEKKKILRKVILKTKKTSTRLNKVTIKNVCISTFLTCCKILSSQFETSLYNYEHNAVLLSSQKTYG